MLAAKAPRIARELLANNQLEVVGERPSLLEFIESRVVRYGFDSSRYPMYFGSEAFAEHIRPAIIRRGSSTEYLASAITATAQRERSLRDAGIHEQDISLVNEALPGLVEVVRQRDAAAITRSLFAGKLGSPQHESATSRLISALYIQQYMEELQCGIAIGIPPLTAFERLATLGRRTNIGMLSRLLVQCGFARELYLDAEDNDSLVVALRGTHYQQEFSQWLAVLCRSIDAYASRSESLLRPNRVNALLGAARGDIASLQPAKNLYDSAIPLVLNLVSRLRAIDKGFAESYERQLQSDREKTVVLIVTATKVETRALHEVAQGYSRHAPSYLPKPEYIAVDLGFIKGLRLVNVQCEAGSVGPSSSQAVITDAIRDFDPSAVILGGIAFGAKPGTQRLGDVLVSKMIDEYEKQKIKSDAQIPRGQRIEASPKLLSLFRAAEAADASRRVHFGMLLSGEKLIDSKDFLDALIRQEPEAIGGEMEGAGLVAASHRAKKDWIVVKAIVDWGHSKALTNDDSQQQAAARNAFGFVFDALTKIGL